MIISPSSNLRLRRTVLIPVVAFGIRTTSSVSAPSRGAIATREILMSLGRSETMNVSGLAWQSEL